MNGQQHPQKKLSKNQRRRLKRKLQKHQQKSQQPVKKKVKKQQQPVLVLKEADIDQNEALIEQFKGVFEKFTQPDAASEQVESKAPTLELDNDNDNDDLDNSEESKKKHKIGKTRRKKLERFTIPELKQLVNRPDLVETHDINSPDALLLLHLKSLANSVPVPRHWNAFGRYLQSKRGKERVSYKLPEHIAQTGINTVRAALAEQEANAKAKTKARQRMQPKMGKMDIDYQVLHDAFFKLQKKPKMTNLGELYYQGMEYESSAKNFKPGVLSKNLREALGMTATSPPPWLINMQRYGPPPSYPNLKIPGVNAPIPDGEVYGLHPGGWGKAPVDQFGRPLYGDVFGTEKSATAAEEPVDKTLWGVAVEDDEESSDEEDEGESSSSEDEEEPPQDVSAKTTPQEKPHQPSSPQREIVAEKEEEQLVDLRKSIVDEEENKSLYKVLKQTTATVGADTFGASYKYNVKDDDKKRKAKDKKSVKSADQKNNDEDDLEANFKF